MHYFGMSTYQFIPYHANAVHQQTHIRILKPFEDSEPMGLKVDIANCCCLCMSESSSSVMFSFLSGVSPS